jgi:hypothetical protein
MEGGEGEGVGGMEDLEGAGVEAAGLAAGPEGVEAGRGDAFEMVVPEAVVEVDGDGEGGIEEIAAPGEIGGADQRREMAAFGFRGGDVAEGAEDAVGGVNLPRLEPEVEIALRAPEGVWGEIGGVGEALQDGEVEAAGGEGGGDFVEFGLEAGEFAGVVAGVFVEAGLDGGGEGAGAEGGEGEGEVGGVGEAEELAPFGFGEGAEFGWVALGKAERIEEGAEGAVHGEAGVSWMQRATAEARSR